MTQLLRMLRERAGLTVQQVAAQMEWDASKISRLETGNWKRIQPYDLRGLLAVYGVTDSTEQDEYVQLARDAGKRGWWTPYADVIGPYVGFEAEAAAIHTYEPAYIPGLLQTEDYARALVQANPTTNPEAGERRVAVQMERQKLLTGEEPPELWVVVWEPAIRCPVGGAEVMREQLDYLRRVATAQEITVQVLPLAAGAHPGMDGAFVLLTFADPIDQPVIYIETATDGLYPEGEEVERRYTQMFNHLRVTALSASDSRAVIDDAMARLNLS